MIRLWNLLDQLPPVLAITGLTGADYHCDKCSQRAAVRHPVLAFQVLHPTLWNGRRPESVFLYLLTVEHNAFNVVVPRYVGISKAGCLRRRWTRRPTSEKANYPSGSLLHHAPATLHWIETEIAGLGFARGMAGLRLYANVLPPLVAVAHGGTIHSPRTRRLPVPQDAAEEYAFAQSMVDDTVQLMQTLRLQPWNRAGATQTITELLGAGVWADARFRRATTATTAPALNNNRSH